MAHMGAAVAQELHHLRLILRRIELSLHGLRLGRDLAERKRRRKNLDQNWLHGAAASSIRVAGDNL